MKIWLKPDGPDEVRVVSGGFERTFIRSEEPFEVSEHDWDRVLKPTSYLVATRPRAASKKPSVPVAAASGLGRLPGQAPEAPPRAAHGPATGGSKTKEG